MSLLPSSKIANTFVFVFVCLIMCRRLTAWQIQLALQYKNNWNRIHRSRTIKVRCNKYIQIRYFFHLVLLSYCKLLIIYILYAEIHSVSLRCILVKSSLLVQIIKRCGAGIRVRALQCWQSWLCHSSVWPSV